MPHPHEHDQSWSFSGLPEPPANQSSKQSQETAQDSTPACFHGPKSEVDEAATAPFITAFQNNQPGPQTSEEMTNNAEEAAQTVDTSYRRESEHVDFGGNTKAAESTVSIHDLSAEILLKIATLAFGRPFINVDVLYRWKCGYTDKASNRLRHGFPAELWDMRGFLGGSKGLRNAAIQAIRHNALFHCNSSDIKDLANAFGLEWCQMIGKLRLKMQFNEKIWEDIEWPALIQTISRDVPELFHICLWTAYSTHNAAYPESETGDPAGSVTRHQQERRALERLGAFMSIIYSRTNPQKGLPRIIVPADSGPTYQLDEYVTQVYVVLDRGCFDRPGDCRYPWTTFDKLASKNAIKKTTHETRILNATAICRLTKAELARAPIEQLTINPKPGQSKDEIWSSQVSDDDETYLYLHERAYLTDEELEAKSLTKRTVDELITICRDVRAQTYSSQSLDEMRFKQAELRVELTRKIVELENSQQRTNALATDLLHSEYQRHKAEEDLQDLRDNQDDVQGDLASKIRENAYLHAELDDAIRNNEAACRKKNDVIEILQAELKKAMAENAELRGTGESSRD